MHKVQHISQKELDLLEYFYQHRMGHVRQIKNATKLSEHTLLKYLSSLEKQQILVSQKKGNLKTYEIDIENAFVKVFFPYFDLERLEAIEYKRKKAIRILISEIKNIKIPYCILLFGSTAKGNYTAKSDIDIIIIFETLEESIPEKIGKIRRNILAETGIKINSIIMKIGEFLKEKENKQNYALQDAISSGYPVFGNQLYYEAMI